MEITKFAAENTFQWKKHWSQHNSHSERLSYKHRIKVITVGLHDRSFLLFSKIVQEMKLPSTYWCPLSLAANFYMLKTHSQEPHPAQSCSLLSCARGVNCFLFLISAHLGVTVHFRFFFSRDSKSYSLCPFIIYPLVSHWIFREPLLREALSWVLQRKL